MKSAAVRFWLGLLLLALAAYAAYTGWKVYDRLAQSDPAVVLTLAAADIVGRQVQPFKLTERSGREFDSHELEGQVWVASFFFSSCPGACIQMNNTLARLQEEFKDSGVKFVSITVDPANDNPEKLQQYAQHFGADPQTWLFLTGPEEEIRRLSTEDFQVAYGPSVHSDRLMVVDRHGKVQGAYRATEDAQMVLLKRKLSQMLKDTKIEDHESHESHE
jgi:cytochrome oxidase Cu insertion factor (SCO1/SenC/PrrC family)